MADAQPVTVEEEPFGSEEPEGQVVAVADRIVVIDYIVFVVADAVGYTSAVVGCTEQCYYWGHCT